MVDCAQTSAAMRRNNCLKISNFRKSAVMTRYGTKAKLADYFRSCIEKFLEENGGSILCLETRDVDVTRVLLAQVLIYVKKDTNLKEESRKNLNKIVFTDFSSFTGLSLHQHEHFENNFPDLLVCLLDKDEQLDNIQSDILKSWKNVVKVKCKKMIFIAKNPMHLEKILMGYDMVNRISIIKLDKWWTENDDVCEVQNILENILENNETTLARALDEWTNINIKEEIFTGKTKLDAVNRDGNTQLHLGARDGKAGFVESLLIHKTKRDVKNNYDETALHLAAKNGHNAIVHMLLEHEFNVNVADNNQWTALTYACNWHNDVHLIEILLKFGAEIERKDDCGRTALHWASLRGHSAVVTLLLKNRANINAQINDGKTPLHLATLHNTQEVVLILLQHGALLNIKDKNQQNALDIAKNMNRTTVIEIFKFIKSAN